MTWLTLRRAVVLSALFAALFAASAAAGRVPAGTAPATIVLPAGWTASGAAAGTRFNASAPSGYGRLQVTSGGSSPSSLPFAQFVKIETSSALKAYRSEDPKAVVSGKQVTLPSGPAVEITATVHRGTPLSIMIFSFLHKGVTYHFTYFTYATSIGALRGAFEASARSIRFK